MEKEQHLKSRYGVNVRGFRGDFFFFLRESPYPRPQHSSCVTKIISIYVAGRLTSNFQRHCFAKALNINRGLGLR